MVDFKNKEILTYLLLIVVGYCIAKIFSRSYNRFSVGCQINCSDYINEKGCGHGFSTFKCIWKNGKCVDKGPTKPTKRCRAKPRYQATPQGQECYTIPISKCESDYYCELY